MTDYSTGPARDEEALALLRTDPEAHFRQTPKSVVRSLDDLRQAKSGRPAQLCPDCGGSWFRLVGRPNDPPAIRNGAITLDTDGLITGYAGIPICLECDRDD